MELIFCCVKERDDLMLNIINKEIEIEESLESRLRVICDFCNTTPIIITGSIRRIDKTDLTYIELHRIYIKNNLYLAFNYSSDIYVNNLGKKIKNRDERIEDLENKLEFADDTIDMLEDKVSKLQEALNYFKEL